MKPTKTIMFLMSCLMVLTSGCYLARYDGPYKGRVIDADTGTPIEGVVVLGVWSKVAVTPAGGVSSYYDAQETATDRGRIRNTRSGTKDAEQSCANECSDI